MTQTKLLLTAVDALGFHGSRYHPDALYIHNACPRLFARIWFCCKFQLALCHLDSVYDVLVKCLSSRKMMVRYVCAPWSPISLLMPSNVPASNCQGCKYVEENTRTY